MTQAVMPLVWSGVLVQAQWGAGMFTPTEITRKAWAVAHLTRRCPHSLKSQDFQPTQQG